MKGHQEPSRATPKMGKKQEDAWRASPASMGRTELAGVPEDMGTMEDGWDMVQTVDVDEGLIWYRCSSLGRGKCRAGEEEALSERYPPGRYAS